MAAIMRPSISLFLHRVELLVFTGLGWFIVVYNIAVLSLPSINRAGIFTLNASLLYHTILFFANYFLVRFRKWFGLCFPSKLQPGNQAILSWICRSRDMHQVTPEPHQHSVTKIAWFDAQWPRKSWPATQTSHHWGYWGSFHSSDHYNSDSAYWPSLRSLGELEFWVSILWLAIGSSVQRGWNHRVHSVLHLSSNPSLGTTFKNWGFALQHYYRAWTTP